MFKLQRYFYEPIGMVTSENIYKENKKMVEKQEEIAQICIIALVWACIFGFISYVCLARRVS